MSESSQVDTRIVVKRLMVAGINEVKACAIATEIYASKVEETPVQESVYEFNLVNVLKFCSIMSVGIVTIIAIVGGGIATGLSIYKNFL